MSNKDGQMVLSKGRTSSERYSVRRKDFWVRICSSELSRGMVGLGT